MTKLLLSPDTAVSPDITFTENASCFDMIWETGHFINPKENDLSILEFVCESLPAGKLTDYMLSDLGCPVVSARLRALLENNGIDNIQYFPASVREGSNGVSKHYFAANIIGLVDCIDTDQSDMDAEIDENGEPTIIYSIDKLALKDVPSEVGRLYRAFPFERIILIDSYFSQLFDNNGITGIKCVAPDRWDGINGEV